MNIIIRRIVVPSQKSVTAPSDPDSRASIPAQQSAARGIPRATPQIDRASARARASSCPSQPFGTRPPGVAPPPDYRRRGVGMHACVHMRERMEESFSRAGARPREVVVFRAGARVTEILGDARGGWLGQWPIVYTRMTRSGWGFWSTTRPILIGLGLGFV